MARQFFRPAAGVAIVILFVLLVVQFALVGSENGTIREPSQSRAVSQASDLYPNILFIMADDHTSQGIGAYGGYLAKLNPTPTIDTLAREGVLMENVFCTNSIFVPSRASLGPRT